MTSQKIMLAAAEAADLPAFRRELQEAFAVAVVEEFGALPDGPIPSDEDLDASIVAPGAVTLRILSDGSPVGGAVATIDAATQRIRWTSSSSRSAGMAGVSRTRTGRPSRRIIPTPSCGGRTHPTSRSALLRE